MSDSDSVNQKPLKAVMDYMPIPAHTRIFKLHQEAMAALRTSKVQDAVKLPTGIEENEWIASQVLGIFEEMIYLKSLLEEFCTEDTCPKMSAGKHIEYRWSDPYAPDECNRMPRQLSAPDYMNTLASFAYDLLSNRQIIPIDGSPMPEDFCDHMKMLLKRIFRVYAHTYIHHFVEFRDMGVEAHLNCCFKRFIFFVLEFDLVPRTELQALNDRIGKYLAQTGKKKAKEANAKKHHL